MPQFFLAAQISTPDNARNFVIFLVWSAATDNENHFLFLPLQLSLTQNMNDLPNLGLFDAECLCADGLVPVLNGLGDELRAIVRTHERRGAAQDEQVAQGVDGAERPERLSIVSPAMNEVI